MRIRYQNQLSERTLFIIGNIAIKINYSTRYTIPLIHLHGIQIQSASDGIFNFDQNWYKSHFTN